MRGFYLNPADELSDEDYQNLNAEQRGIWDTIKKRCYCNRRPWTHKGLDMPAYSMITTMVELVRLSNVRGRTQAAEKKVRRCVQQLSNARWLDVQPVRNRYTVLILAKAPKWQDFDTYRGRPKGDRRPTDVLPMGIGKSPTTSTTPTSKKTTSRKRSSTDSLPELAYQLADHCRDTIVSAQPTHLLAKDAKWATTRTPWATTLDKANRLDSRSWSDLRRVWDWCRDDSFERTNVLSPSKLRKRYDDLDLKSRQRNGVTIGKYVAPRLASDWTGE